MRSTPDLSSALRHAVTDDELLACFPAMSELRPHLSDPYTFVATCHRMSGDGYRILAAWAGDEVVALAGYRVQENFVFGKFLYLDDLVTKTGVRGLHWGMALMSRLRSIASEQGCARLVLDTALNNTLAQRFYFRAGLLPLAFGFSVNIEPGGP
jgi:ribosomal protein S18 acetylase RimI-like enzyme